MKHLQARQHHLKGFSLLEMAIVLSIIALVIAGILIGGVVRQNAKIQALIGEIDRYRGAMVVFKEKYKDLPGDFSKAQDIWGASVTCPPTTSDALLITTCNGDGNGTIGTKGITTIDSTTLESLLFWQHLSNAKLISRAYSGTISTNVSGYVGLTANLNIPLSAMDGLYFGVKFLNPSDLKPDNLKAANFKHTFVLGTPQGGADSYRYAPNETATALTCDQAFTIDSRIDDGMPNSGKLRIYIGTNAANCAGGSADYSQPYVSSGTLPAPLVFITGM